MTQEEIDQRKQQADNKRDFCQSLQCAYLMFVIFCILCMITDGPWHALFALCCSYLCMHIHIELKQGRL